MNEEKAEVKPRWIKNTTGGEIIVTTREYQQVLGGLKLPDDYFLGGEKVLCVGEGLSDFARKLQEEKRVEVLSVDPIYELGVRVLQQDPHLVKQALEEYYKGKVLLADNEGIRSLLIKIPQLNPKIIIAGSVYELPFVSQSFNSILSFKLFEHLDFPQSLPELLRVLGPHGEIRMGGLNLNCDTKNRVISNQTIEIYDFIQLDKPLHPGLGNTLEILAQNNCISTYVLIDEYPRKKIREIYPDLLLGTVLIIRNDDHLPKIEFKETQIDNPYMNKLVKLLPSGIFEPVKL